MKVSVFVVTYNQEKYIRQCLDSVLMQQVNFDYEIVIGEDHSMDGTREICEDYAHRYSNIRLLPIMSNNIGVARNWRRVLSECKGDYIAMCEGDDYWTDSLKLQKQVDFFDFDIKEKYSLSFHDVMLQDEEGHIIEESKTEGGIAKEDRSSYDLIRGYHPSTQTVMFRAKYLTIILKKMEKYKWNNNDAILFSLLGEYGEGKFLPSIGKSVWRIHCGSVWSSATKLNKMLNIYNTYTYLQKLHPGLKQYYSSIRVSNCKNILYESVRQRNISLIISYYVKSCMLFVEKRDFKGLWNIQKGIAYNLIYR